MSEELNNELINLYNFYNTMDNPPHLKNTIKNFLLEVEGINPDEITPGDTKGD